MRLWIVLRCVVFCCAAMRFRRTEKIAEKKNTQTRAKGWLSCFTLRMRAITTLNFQEFDTLLLCVSARKHKCSASGMPFYRISMQPDVGYRKLKHKHMHIHIHTQRERKRESNVATTAATAALNMLQTYNTNDKYCT